jgi:hypothetical protein
VALESIGQARRAQAGGQDRAQGLQTAKEILAEVFCARTGEVEGTIQEAGGERA